MKRQLGLAVGLGLLLTSSIFASCGLTDKLGAKKAAPTAQAVGQSDPGRPTIVILDRGSSWESFALDLYRLGEKGDYFVTTASDPFVRPIAVFSGKDSDKNWAQVGTVNLNGVTDSNTGWVFLKNGATPKFQAAGPRDQLIREASAFFGDEDLAKAFPWRVVVYLSGEAENPAMATKQYETVASLVATKDVHVTKWTPGSDEPVTFTGPGDRKGTVEPAKVTQEKAGWVFAEDGKAPQFQPAASLPEVLRNMSSYFQMDISMNRSRLQAQGAEGEATQGAAAGRGAKGMRNGQMRPTKMRIKGEIPQKGAKVRRPGQGRQGGQGGATPE